MLKNILAVTVAGLIGYAVGQFPANKAYDGAAALEPIAPAATATRHVCPMHPEIVSDTPGTCPICGMDLVEEKDETHAHADETADVHGLPMVTLDPSVAHNLGVRTAEAVHGALQRSIETIGKITRIDPMARRTLNPPIRGELLWIADKQEGDRVKAGELLFSVKSDELFEHEKSFQDIYRSGDRATANAMIPRLSVMGLNSDQIARLQTGAAPEMPVEVRAFEDGFVYTRRGQAGDPVHPGYTVFNVGGNYNVVEVTAEIFERQWGWVEEGQSASMTVRGLPGKVFRGKVVRIEPPVGYTTRSLEVALHFRTSDAALSQSMFAHVSIAGRSLKNVLTVPADSVIRTGHGDRVVVVRAKNRFQPVPVVAGEEADGRIEIRSGLKAGDKVVASGQFLIDSESNLAAGFRRMSSPGAHAAAAEVPAGKADDRAAHPHAARAGAASGQAGS